MAMNIDTLVSVPVAGLPNLLANIVGQQVGPGPFEQLRVKLTQPAGGAAGDILVSARASGRVLKETSSIPNEEAAGLGATERTPYFVDETVQLGEQLFLEAQNTTAGAIVVRVQAQSVPL